MVKCFLLFYLLTFLPLPSEAQGLSLIRNYTAAEYGGHNRCYDIEIGEDGTVFVANFEGLLYYDHARWRIIHSPDISRVTVVYRDSKNTIWVGGYNFFARVQKRANGELFMQQIGRDGQFQGEVVEIYEEGGSLLFVASDNNIYEVSGSTISLKKRTNAKFRPGVGSDIVSIEALHAGEEDAILDDITQTIVLDGGQQVKVKKNCGLIVTDDHGHDLYTITEDDGLCSNQVAYVAYDGHGMLWGATSHGIFSLEIPSVYSYFLAKDGLSGEVHAITAFDDKIYVGSTNGLYSIIPQQCRRVANINNICWMLCQSRDVLLAATSSGIYKITRGGSISRLTSNATTALLVDGDNVYAGESDGVYCYPMDKMVNGQKVDDLPLVTEIRKDAHGGFWFRNVHGETRGSDPGKPRDPVADLPAHLFMPVSGIDVKAQYRHGGQVWIGGDEILVIVDTDKQDLAALTDSRRICFRSIMMGGDSVLWGGYGDMPEKLQKIDSDKGHLHFFYALDYVPLSGKTQYRYKLSSQKIWGTDGQWSAWTDKQDVAFLNLPYGSFTLSVQARLANGELSEVTSVGFSIAYPLLMRWYMVSLYFIIFAYIVYLLLRYRLKRLQKEKTKLEQIVKERTADLRNAQDELIRQEKMATVGKLTEGLIDRIQNPMNYIINFSKLSNDLLNDLKEDIGNESTVKTDGQVIISEAHYEDALDIIDMLAGNLHDVDMYGQNTSRMLKAMAEMLKDRTGSYVDMDLLPVLQQNKEMFSKYYANEKEQYHIHTTFALPSSAMLLHGNPSMLSKAIMNLLANAVYAVVRKAQRVKDYIPEVSLTATVTDGRYVLKIRDNGTGIEEKLLDKIFNPFFTTKTTSEATGIGLYLTHEIIQNHKGDINVASVRNEYTEFTIMLPMVKE
ncbi:MAG: GHKL domain-containing protein [Prevotella sp.]|nr:GHKL domain-containing protein [Prevotella sp.]